MYDGTKFLLLVGVASRLSLYKTRKATNFSKNFLKAIDRDTVL